jgi:hypothetical protein
LLPLSALRPDQLNLHELPKIRRFSYPRVCCFQEQAEFGVMRGQHGGCSTQAGTHRRTLLCSLDIS